MYVIKINVTGFSLLRSVSDNSLILIDGRIKMVQFPDDEWTAEWFCI